jgi:hypothetical protein
VSGRDTAALLEQDSIWIDGTGRVHALDEMDHNHRANLIPFLRRSAVALAAWCDLELTPAEAETWLVERPLMRRLTELDADRPIDDRRGTHERNQAHETETGYVKRRILSPAEALDRQLALAAAALDSDGGEEW